MDDIPKDIMVRICWTDYPLALRLVQVSKRFAYLKPRFLIKGVKMAFKDGLLSNKSVQKLASLDPGKYWVYHNELLYKGLMIEKLPQEHLYIFKRVVEGLSVQKLLSNHIIGAVNLRTMVLASKCDDVEFIKRSGFKEHRGPLDNDITGFKTAYGLETYQALYSPNTVWRVFWLYGGPKVKSHLSKWGNVFYEGIEGIDYYPWSN